MQLSIAKLYYVATIIYAEAVEDEVRLMLLEDWADDNDNDEWMEPHVLSSRGDLRLVTNDDVSLTGAGRLEASHACATVLYCFYKYSVSVLS